MTAPQERVTTMDALRLAMVVIAALAFWQCAKAMNAALHTRGLTSTEAMLAETGKVTSSETNGPGLGQRFTGSLRRNACIHAAALFMLAVGALLIRVLFGASALEAVHEDRKAQNKGTMCGFLFRSWGLFLLLGIIYAMAVFSSPTVAGTHSGMVPLLMLLLMAAATLWALVVRFFAFRDSEQVILKGGWFSALFSALGFIGLAVILWINSGADAAAIDAFHTGRPVRNILLSATTALAVCAVEFFILSKIYRKKRIGVVKMVILGVFLLAVVLFSGFVTWVNWAPVAA